MTCSPWKWAFFGLLAFFIALLIMGWQMEENEIRKARTAGIAKCDARIEEINKDLRLLAYKPRMVDDVARCQFAGETVAHYDAWVEKHKPEYDAAKQYLEDFGGFIWIQRKDGPRLDWETVPW